MYVTTKNPLYAWRGLQLCLECMDAYPGRCEPLPPWLQAYLSAGADQMQQAYYQRLEHPKKKTFDVPNVIAAALGFQQPGRGKRRDVFLEFERDAQNASWAAKIRGRAEREPTQPIAEIVAALAEAEQVSEETLWRVWREWKLSLVR